MKINILNSYINRRQFISFGIFSIIFVLIYILNYLYPLFADDISYSFVFTTPDRIASISDIFVSQYNHYYRWGGRSVIHFTAQFLLYIDFWIACLLNSLAYIGLLYLMYRIIIQGSGKSKIYQSVSLIVFLHIFIWFCQPAFCCTVLWKTGSSNYLWGTLIVLSFVYPYYKYLNVRKTDDKLLKIILLFLSGIIAGWTNENVGVALIFFIVLSVFTYKYFKIRIPKWSISGLIGVIIGYIFMVSAPGNYKRMEFFLMQQAKDGMTRFDIAKNILDLSIYYFIHYILPLLIIYGLLLLIYYKTNKEKKKGTIACSLFFVSSGIVSFLIMLASPQFPERSLFGTIIFLIIPIGILYNKISFDLKLFRMLSIGCVILLTTVFSYDYYRKYNKRSS